ncbi:MAG: hypothetical protein HY764_00115 [Candidatus Portnoybacteria bacterium]|nr:hypothetical protein [Candidatus Portnoybacteria bacterium]
MPDEFPIKTKEQVIADFKKEVAERQRKIKEGIIKIVPGTLGHTAEEIEEFQAKIKEEERARFVAAAHALDRPFG